MAPRHFHPAALALVASLAACAQDAPTGSHTVRLAIMPGAEHGGRPMHAAMTQETWTSGYAGDADGTGTALLTINPGQGEVCWQLSVSDIRLPATAAHIHKAEAGVRGGIVVGLSAPVDGTSSGCASNVSRALLTDILTDPAGYYVNVHNTEFPPGAVRGQLSH